MTLQELYKKSETYSDGAPYDATMRDGTPVFNTQSIETAYVRGIKDYLDEAWHAPHDVPSGTTDRVLIHFQGSWCVVLATALQNKELQAEVVRWAYLKDLLPVDDNLMSV